MVSSVVLTFLTPVPGTGSRGGVSTATLAPVVVLDVATLRRGTRGQSFGPDAASGTSWALGSMYQFTDRSSHGCSPRATPVTTAGLNASGVTSSEPATS